MRTRRVPAATLKRGDVVVDPATGDRATVMDRRPTRSKYAPGKVSVVAEMDDGRWVRLTVADTDPLDIVVT